MQIISGTQTINNQTQANFTDQQSLTMIWDSDESIRSWQFGFFIGKNLDGTVRFYHSVRSEITMLCEFIHKLMTFKMCKWYIFCCASGTCFVIYDREWDVSKRKPAL